MSGSEITIKIGGDSKGLASEVEKVKKALKDLGGEGAKAPTTANLAFGSFIGNLASSATTAALSKVADLFGFIAGEALNFAKAAEEDAKAFNQLNISLAATGQYSQETAAKMEAFTGELERSSNFTSSAIANTAAYIEQVSRLSVSELPRATQASADFASALGVDIETASKVVGKALAGNVEALGRYGIELKSTGDKAADAEMVLKTLESRFGGAALASINTFSGAQNQVSVAYEDMGKAIASNVTGNSALIGAMQGVAAIFTQFQKIVEDNKEAISDFVTNGVLFFVDGISVAGKAVAFFVQLSGDFEAFFNFVDDMILASIQGFYELQAGTANVAANIKEFFGGNADSLRAFQAQAEAAIQGFQAARDSNDQETAKLIANTDSKVEAITNFANNAEQLVRDKVEAAQKAEQDETNNFLEQMNARGEANRAFNEQLTAEQIAKKELETLQSEENLLFIQEVLGREAALREQARIDELTKTGSYAAALKQMRATMTKAEQEQIFAVQKYEDLSQKQRLANLQSTLGTISSLQSSSSKELFMVGKAAAIATATIDGFAAVQKALASAPPPINFALAAAVGAVTVANVAKIASSKPPTGAFDGAMVSGGSGYKDDQPFMLSKGELVAPAKNFDQVVEGAAREKGFVKGDENAAIVVELQLLRQELQGSKSVTINGDVLADESYISRLADMLADNTRFRNGPLATRS